MYKNLKIGLAVLNYNAGEKVIESILNIYGYKTIDKIVVVDNHSTDESLEIINKKLLGIDKIKIINAPRNGGWSYGYNIACKYLVENEKVDYIVIMTPANFFPEDTLLKLCEAISIHNEYAVVTGVLKSEKGILPKKIGWKRYGFSYCILSQNCFLRKYLDKKICTYITDNTTDSIIPVNVVQGSFYIIRGDALVKIGYFDEDVFLFCEEVILSSRLHNIGYNNAGVVIGCEYSHISSYSVKKNVMPYNSYKYLMQSRYIYAKKYLKVSKPKLAMLKIAMKYGMVEKKFLTAILK